MALHDARNLLGERKESRRGMSPCHYVLDSECAEGAGRMQDGEHIAPVHCQHRGEQRRGFVVLALADEVQCGGQVLVSVRVGGQPEQ